MRVWDEKVTCNPVAVFGEPSSSCSLISETSLLIILPVPTIGS